MSNICYLNLKVRAETHKYVVYEAVRTKDERSFAKKELRSECTASEADRFRNEARLLARLDHPNIIKVVDQQLTDSPLYVVTPLYTQNLREWLRSQNVEVINEPEIKEIFSQILDAIAYAHAEGVIHRDLKPENILLNSPREVVVIDFNISVSADSTFQRLTPSGYALGTPHYLAPEQLRDACSVDTRTDIYSLGVVLFELYGGRVGSSTLDLQLLPPIIRSIVDRCTKADRTKRFSTVRDLISAWRLANDINTKQSEVNELELFMLLVEESGTCSAERVLCLLETYEDDDDLVNRFFMDASEVAITAVVAVDTYRVERLIHRWTRFFSCQSWPFSYTDDIARRCQLLWNWIESPGIRAELIGELIILGNRHNRFFVWRAAARLVQDSQRTEDVDRLVQRMVSLDERDLRSVLGYLNKQKLSGKLRAVVASLENDEASTIDQKQRIAKYSSSTEDQSRKPTTRLSLDPAARARHLSALRRALIRNTQND